ncbi:MAG TPA: hypothetical protein VLH08_07825 [Acidobacteriota bacterium]|nr:hypothetical protein [Acidobacteriota bacterium]
MKITFFRDLQSATKTLEASTASTAVNKVLVNPKQLSELPKKTGLPNELSNLGKGEIPGGLGQKIPGLDKNGLPGGIGKNGFPGISGLTKDGFENLGKQGLPGLPGNSASRLEGFLGSLGKFNLPGTGKDIFGNGTGLGNNGLGSGKGFSGLNGFLGGIGSNRGPAIKIPGADRMDGDTSLGAIFGKGTWDFGPGGFHGSISGGVTSHGYGIGMNDKGEVGVAKGDHEGGSVTSIGDAKGAANSAINGSGSSNKNSGVPEGMDWSRGTRVKDTSSTKDIVPPASSEPKKTEGPNDLGPSTNDPSKEKKDENETAVAQNDTTKGTQSGKPNPDAMPNPEDSGGGTPRSRSSAVGNLVMPNPEDTGGGTPRSSVASSAFFTPNPEDAGGGTPRSRSSALGQLFMPNPEDSGGGTPRSVIANVAMKLRG